MINKLIQWALAPQLSDIAEQNEAYRKRWTDEDKKWRKDWIEHYNGMVNALSEQLRGALHEATDQKNNDIALALNRIGDLIQARKDNE